MTVDHDFFRSPQDFGGALADLQTASWPPTETDLQHLADRCASLIASIDAWETETGGQNVVDIDRGEISTAEVRRILAREVTVSYEGDIAVLLVPAGERRVRVELRSFVDDHNGVLRRPELVLDWQHDGQQHEHYVPCKRKGPQWYMLSQLRDDLLEDRLARS
ncbi:hypothetical protein ACFS27_13475 [Promicromonospora vindobonensis]|uniref:Uncharacterized protein n=1 Tax=Promicromonospora vindobonensis TaxID=195748 RepID=A0ABW5VWW5_9MICO